MEEHATVGSYYKLADLNNTKDRLKQQVAIAVAPRVHENRVAVKYCGATHQDCCYRKCSTQATPFQPWIPQIITKIVAFPSEASSMGRPLVPLQASQRVYQSRPSLQMSCCDPIEAYRTQ